jgi:pimeloyl-ACP methyl ester carboxylesterase
VAGNSLCGHLAWATAVLHPGRVAKLVLVDSAGYPSQAQSMPLAFRIANVKSSLQNVYGDPTLELVGRIQLGLETNAGQL